MRNKIRLFFKSSFPSTNKVDVIVWMSAILATSLIGFIIAFFTYREAFDFGDLATFYQFAHNLANGEVIYKDFIHFRTPGAYFFQAWFVQLFGDQMSSVMLAIHLEVHPLFMLIFGPAIGLILRFKHRILGIATLACVIFLPGVLSFRAAFALLAISFYIQALRTPQYRKAWLFGAGVFSGIAFIFGQETAAMVIATVAIAELCMLRKSIVGQKLKEAGTYIAGLIVGLAPLLIYVIAYSDISNFIYYTIYYAFILQPQGMDVLYPEFSYNNLLFFLVPAIIVIAFYIFYSSKKMGVYAAVLIAFVLARFITLFGRSDLGHLIFVLPDVIFLAFFALISVKSGRYDRKTFYAFLPYGIVLAISLYGAIYMLTSFWIIVGMVAIMLAFRFRNLPSSEIKTWRNESVTIYSILLVVITLCGYIMYPLYYDTIASMTKRGLTAESISGLNTKKDIYDFVVNVEQVVKKYRPQTIFSYPIQPYYYSLAPHHAARFITFEPQTTVAEQDQTISDLKRTKPEVIIMDPAQATGMSGSLWKINNYITSNYEIADTITGRQVLWIMTPKEHAKAREALVLNIYKDNELDMSIVRDIQSPDKGIVDGLQLASNHSAVFDVDKAVDYLVFSIYDDPGDPSPSCGKITQMNGSRIVSSVDVCEGNGQVSVPINQDVTSVRLENHQNKTMIFNQANLVKL